MTSALLGDASAATPGTGSPALALWQALSAAHASLAERLDPEADACAVMGTDAVAVLLPLSLAADRQLRMHELAARSQLTRSGLTRRVDRLVDDGWVERVHCDADRRGAYARLTDAGATELARALPHHVAALERHLAGRLGAAEVTALTELLVRLSRDLPGEPAAQPGRDGGGGDGGGRVTAASRRGGEPRRRRR